MRVLLLILALLLPKQTAAEDWKPSSFKLNLSLKGTNVCHDRSVVANMGPLTRANLCDPLPPLVGSGDATFSGRLGISWTPNRPIRGTGARLRGIGFEYQGRIQYPDGTSGNVSWSLRARGTSRVSASAKFTF